MSLTLHPIMTKPNRARNGFAALQQKILLKDQEDGEGGNYGVERRHALSLSITVRIWPMMADASLQMKQTLLFEMVMRRCRMKGRRSNEILHRQYLSFRRKW